MTKIDETRRPTLPSYPLPPPQATETEKPAEVALVSAIFRTGGGLDSVTNSRVPVPH